VRTSSPARHSSLRRERDPRRIGRESRLPFGLSRRAPLSCLRVPIPTSAETPPMRRACFCCAPFTLVLTLALAPAADAPPAGPVAFRGARIHTAAGKPIDNGVLVIDKGKVVAVGSADTVAIPAGARVIDAAGRTIIPGLVDSHSHVGIFP